MPLTYNQTYGKFFGYPDCCIKSFGEIAILFLLRPTEVKQATLNGFVPCLACAKKLIAKQITYEELINPNRRCTIPFKPLHITQERLQIDNELDQLTT